MIHKINPRNTQGKEYFAYWEGFLSVDEIKLLLAQPEWGDGVLGTLDGGIEDVKRRSCYISWLAAKPELADIWAKFEHVVSLVNSKYFHFKLTGFYEQMQLTLYNEQQSGHYDWHVDEYIHNLTPPRKLSMSLLLSDPAEYKGGELQIQYGAEPTTLEQVQGRAWFFPSYMLHRVTPVTAGVRRSLVLWAGGPAFC